MTEFQLSPIENEGKRVLTTAQLAEAYGTDSKVISYNFNHNIKRYTEGKHFYCLTGEELKAFREIHELPKNINTLYLWTERGSLLHAKSLNTDKAWEVHDFLVENYFRVQQEIKQLSPIEMIAKIANNLHNKKPLRFGEVKQIYSLSGTYSMMSEGWQFRSLQSISIFPNVTFVSLFLNFCIVPSLNNFSLRIR